MKLFGSRHDVPLPPPIERSAYFLHRIYVFMAIICVIHVVVFIIFLVIFGLSVQTFNYYQNYLDGPMSGPNVAHTVTGVFGIVDNVHNITSTAAAATNVMSASVGLDVPEAGGRHLLSVADDSIKIAFAGLINATAQKVVQFNATAPSAFLEWIIETDWRGILEPKVIDLIAVAKYGVASMGTVLGALGSPVDPYLVNTPQPQQTRLPRKSYWR